MTAVAERAEPSVWSTLKEAVRGSHQDFTEAPIGRAVVLLAVPMVLEMLMESVFAVVDIFFVGRLGASAVATVGLTESLMVTVYALAIGLSIGAAATVARRIGEKDPERAALTAVQAIILGIGMAAIIGAIGVLFTSSARTGRAKTGLLLNGIVIVVGIVRLGIGGGII